jgi:PAS domain S-box-containing protein
LRSPVAVALAACLVFTSAALAQTTPGTKRVLLLHQTAGPGTFRGRFDLAFVEAIRSGEPASIDLYEESIETGRFPGPEQSNIVKEYLRRKYADRNIDVIVAQGIDPFVFARDNRALFGNPPIVTIVAPTGELAPSDSVTGLQGGFWITGTIELAQKLRPSTQRVYVVDGARENSSRLQAEVERQLTHVRPSLDVVYLRDLPLSEVVSRVSRASERSIVFFVRQTMRTQAQDIDQSEALAQIVRASPVPVFSHLEQMMGHGIVGGSVWRYESDARRLAAMAKRIANGAAVGDVPPERATYATLLDWNALQRWNIPESRIPPGSVILFREQSFFQRYWTYVVVVAVLIFAEAGLIAMMWIQRARRRDSEARTTAVLRAAPDLMFVQDRHGVYLDYYAPADETLYVPPEQFLGRKMKDILPPDCLQRVLPLFERVWTTDQPVVGEYDMDFPQGRRRFEARLVRCGPDKVLSVVRDVTERARAQQALVERDQRHVVATAAGGTGVWDWNLDTNDMYVDPRVKALLGLEHVHEADRFEEWWRRVHADDLDAVLSQLRDHVEGKTPSFEAEFRMPHRDGTIRWILARGSVVREEGRPARVVGTYTDFTERKQADDALLKAQAEVDRMSRLAAFGEFTASIAHELSQPLTVIVVNARMCLRMLKGRVDHDVDEIKTIISEVVDAGKRADAIIHRNRQLFRRQIVNNQRVDVNDVVREVALLSGPQLRSHKVRWETQLASSLPTILGDRVEISQILVNLVTNAIDAMKDVDEQSRIITITTAQTPRHEVQVSVCDTGKGLESVDVDVDRMFTTGYTTKATGTGVGLSICRTIVEAHGGRIWAERNGRTGAEFRFTIPIAVAMPGAAVPRSDSEMNHLPDARTH